jgi:hypothetical protein
MPRFRKPRTIAPRLASGHVRVPIAHALPPHIKQAVAMIAVSKNQSVSWALEQLIIRGYKIEVPEYVPRKTQPQETTNGEATSDQPVDISRALRVARRR